ncbi:hypothetical protein ONZ45_g16370 [Pleurotus djamor]|nr:hypothetical protein ONZ45_g16370 [Pleurotus djamor]
MEFSPNPSLLTSSRIRSSMTSSLAAQSSSLHSQDASSSSNVSLYDTETHASPTGLFDIESGAELRRHQDLWFPDGSVVCRAENTLFRVHMYQLARRSICFRDMFSVPQPKSLSRKENSKVSAKAKALESLNCIQGHGASDDLLHDIVDCPTLCLQDLAFDVANLFAALYDGPKFGNNNQADFKVVSGILRLSTKYIIESLRDQALAHLSVAWPDNLKAWDAREDLARAYEMETGGHLYPSPLAVISLAREVDAPSLLISAFYDLSRYTFSQIFEPNGDEPLYHSPSSFPPTLASSDVQRLALGKEAFQQAITTLIQAMGQSQHLRYPTTQVHSRNKSSTYSPPGVCVSAAACRKDFSELVELATQHYLFDRERGFSDPLYVAEELGQLKSAEFSECKACARSLENWASREREKIWKMLPTWFRLETADGSGGTVT